MMRSTGRIALSDFFEKGGNEQSERSHGNIGQDHGEKAEGVCRKGMRERKVDKKQAPAEEERALHGADRRQYGDL